MGKTHHAPPKLFHRFFQWFCHPKLLKYIEGDLMELYDERLKLIGKRKADRKFIIDVLLLFRPGIIKPTEGYKNLNTYGMYKSYFKIGWRNLVREKGYSLINIGGLAAGMAIAILIALWIWDEVSYDTHHENYNQIAQVMQHQTVDGYTGSQTSIPRPLEHALRSTYGHYFSRLSMASWTDEHILSFGDKSISQTGNYVQADFPHMLTLKMLAGTRNGLKDPASILLSSSAANALFGTVDPINQSIRIDNTLDVKVTGIYEDLPDNASFKDLKFISSWELYASSQEWMKQALERWNNNSFQLFVQVADGLDVNTVSQKIKNIRADITKDVTFKPEVYLHPMADWHLRSQWQNGINTGGLINLVWLFGIVGVFVLLLACINFINLSTARSEKRAKEVGIRMTIGSVRAQLISQFLSESFLVVLLAFVFAIVLVSLALPWFNDLADKQIVLIWSNPYFWLLSMLFILVTSLLAGSYPALYLSSFRPVNVLKGSFKIGRLTSLPRKVLVVIQFTVSVTLVIGTIVVYEQIQFSKSRSTGYTSNGLITLQMNTPEFFAKYEALRTEITNSGAVVNMTKSSSPLTGIWNNSGGFNWPGKNPNGQFADFGKISITPEYGATVGWKIKEGRDLSREFATDSTAILLNEAAVEFIGVKDPMGMEITSGETKFHVIGIVENLIMESPYKPVRPNIYIFDTNANWIILKLNPEKSASESLPIVAAIFKKHVPSAPFDYKFVDEKYAEKFSIEERMGKLAYIFATLATLISCLGLIGLASFVAEQHTKEIGIRKVLGASIMQLWKLLSGNFIVLVLISNAIAIPISYYLMNSWLLSYEYHTDISWKTFIVTVSGALMITLCTVSYQAIKAAMANPVNSLRSE